MKITAKQFIVSLIIALILGSCSSKGTERDPDFLPEMKIEIPQELAENEEAVEFIKTSESAINEFSDRIEELAIDGKDILNKKQEDLSVMDKLKIGKLAVQFVTNSSQMLNEVNKVSDYIENAQKNGLSDSQIESLKVIEKSMGKRVNEINKKYEHYFDQ